jgi:type I restriction enzyme, S subunit
VSGLPEGWVEATIGEVTLPFVSIDPTKEPNAEFRYVDIGSIDKSTQTIGEPKSFLGRDAPSRARRLIHKGDVLFSTVRTYLKNIAAVPEHLDGALTSTGIAVLRASEAIDSRYLFNWVCSDEFVGKMSGAQDGTLYPAVTDKDVSGASIPLPPLPEQQRIVAKVDGLTARTARARKELNRIPTLIARHKQRFLALAFSGELTAGWRKANPTMQTALEKVRVSRKLDSRLARRKHAASVPDYGIPETWDWVSPDEVAADAKYSIGIGPFGSNLVRTDYRESGVRLVFVRDIRREKFEDNDARYVDESKAAELHQHVASPGDVLITKMGDPPGDSSLFPMDAEPAIITADCIKLTPHDQLATARYLNFAIRSEIVQSQFKAITAGVAQQKVSLDRFRQLALPIAPLEEQAEIVRRIESAFGWLDRMAADHAAAARLLPKLDAAILSKAFRGELVPQDPNDEPASVLLDRIKAMREAAVKATVRRVASQTSALLGTVIGGPVGGIAGAVAGAYLATTSLKRKGNSDMTKSRQDDDVKDKPFLAGLLKSAPNANVQTLFRAANLPVADFYKQLTWEIDKGHILDSAEELKAA